MLTESSEDSDCRCQSYKDFNTGKKNTAGPALVGLPVLGGDLKTKVEELA